MDWKKYGLTDEQIAEINKEIPLEFMPKHVYNEKVEDLKKANETIESREQDIENLKKVDVDSQGLKNQLETLTTQYQTDRSMWETEKTETAKANAVKMMLGSKVHDIDVALSLLNLKKIEVDETGKITGFDEQFTGLKETKSYLFKQEDAPKATGGFVPVDGDKVPPVTEKQDLKSALMGHYQKKE